MTASERIIKLLEHLNLNAVALANALGKDRPQFIYDIVKGKTHNISPTLAKQITSVYTDINSVWLLTGEGNMLNSDTTGNNNTSIAGNSNQINCSSTLEKALDEISEMRKLFQTQVNNNHEQFDRLVSVIENLTKK